MIVHTGNEVLNFLVLKDFIQQHGKWRHVLYLEKTKLFYSMRSYGRK